MNPYTITSNILASQWEIAAVDQPSEQSRDWHYVNTMQISDVAVWETVYYESGVVGVYAAHDPYAEFYAVVPCASCDRISTWRTFWGQSAGSQAQQWLSRELGIHLDTAQTWTNLIAI